MNPVIAVLDAACPAEHLFSLVDDLARYPAWLDLVHKAEPLGPDRWTVVLAARLGPLRRSKQLTMTRTVHQPATRARFERQEPDGKHHAAWVLDAEVQPTDTGSRLTMRMHYDGQWFGPVIERVLNDQIESARAKLAALATAG